MVIRFISWLDRVVRIRSILLFFRLRAHHRVYFRNNLIIPLRILLRAVNTFGDNITGVFSRTSLRAKPTTLLLLLLFLGLRRLYDINLLLKRINLVLQSNLLWLFMNRRNILLVFIIAILIIVYMLTFKGILLRSPQHSLKQALL